MFRGPGPSFRRSPYPPQVRWFAAFSMMLLVGSLLARWSRNRGRVGLEAGVLQVSLALGLLGVLGTLLATVGQFSEFTVGVGMMLIALGCWPWNSSSVRARRPRGEQPSRVWGFALAGVIMVGIALRLPTMPMPLAGRDQGTYSLRAAATARDGGFRRVDRQLAQAGREVSERSGPMDVLGLYDKRSAEGRSGRYESAYRPGLYLSDRDRGEVVPQFFHLHPTLLAVGRLVAADAPGDALGTGLIVALEALLALLAFAAVARRLWPRGVWSLLATALFCGSPLLIWTQRVPLSEGPMLCFGLAALLSLLRARSVPEAMRRRELVAAALYLGFTAWIRGNAFIVAPVFMGILLFRRRSGGVAPHILLAMLFSSLVVHSLTSYPYLYDEIIRQMPALLGDWDPSPGALIGCGAAGSALWLVVDGRIGHSKRLMAWAHVGFPWSPRLMALAACSILGFYATVSWGIDTAPYGRLDPAPGLLGWPLVVLAVVGVLATSLRWSPGPEQAWLVAVASIPVMTLLLYANRNLPRLELYYYGRYLVPELLPLAVLGGTAAVRILTHRLKIRGVDLAKPMAAVVSLGLIWSVAGVLWTDPVTRLREFSGAQRAVDLLARSLPADAVVIAGGEGWHHGHTHNQIGGALALGHGRQLLPYRSQEATYSSLWEILIARGAAGKPVPPVFLLINEASHNYRRADGRSIAGIDDMLPSPFVASDFGFLELFVHSLTATQDRVPTRITRHQLRMVLMRVRVDPLQRLKIERWTAADLPQIGGENPEGPRCLDVDEPLEILVPFSTGQDRGPTSIALIAGPGSGRQNHRWRVEVDGRRLNFDAVGISPRARDTLGPVALETRPRHIKIWGSPAGPKDPVSRKGRGSTPTPCAHGELAELRLSPPDRSQLEASKVAWTESIVPRDDLGQAFERSEWTAARSVNRYRPGTTPRPQISGLSMRLGAGPGLEFALIYLPGGGTQPMHIVVTLTESRVSAETRLVVFVDDMEVARLNPPDNAQGTWPSGPVLWTPTRSVARVRVELHGGGEAGTGPLRVDRRDDQVFIRDVTFFTHGPSGVAPSTP